MQDLINYHEAAELLGVPIGTVYAWVSRKQLPHFRLGPRLVRFSEKELESWIKTHKIEICCVKKGDNNG